MSTRPVTKIGLIIAAGRGRRMGRTKQLANWPAATGTKPLVAAAFDAIHGVCDEMIVVVGHDAERVAAALGDRPFHRAVSDADAEMFESIRAGLAAAQTIDANAIVVLQPGDHPEVSPKTLAALADAAKAQSAQAVLPEFQGRGGHPVFIPPALVALLVDADCPEGLGRFWADHPQACRRLAVDDPSVVKDIDSPEKLGS